MGWTNRRRYAAAVVVGVVGLVLGSGCSAITGESAQETVVVGVDLSLTGDGSALGTVYRDALQLRVEQVNQRELLGDRVLELRILDNRSDPDTAAVNVAELVEDPEVTAIVTGQCGPCLVAAAETINSAGVPTISLASSDEVVEPIEERASIFKLGPNADHDAGALVNELRLAGVSTIGLATFSDRYGEDGKVEMQDAAQRAGIEVVVAGQVDNGEDSARTLGQQIAQWRPEETQIGVGQADDGEPAGPDAVVVWAPGPVAGNLAVALREQGYRRGIYLDAVAADQLFLSGEAGEALDGARMVFTETLVIDDVIATSPAKAARQAWFRDYLAEQGTYDAYSSFAADAIQLIVEGVNRFDQVDRDSVRTAIEVTQIEGLTGPLRMSAENHSGLMPQALTTLVARGDRWRLAG